MTSRRRDRRVPPKTHTTSAESQPGPDSPGASAAETFPSSDRPLGTRSANRAAKRAATGVRAKPMARGGRGGGGGGRKRSSNTGIIVLAIGAVAIAAAVLAFGNPFGSPGASSTPAATVSEQVGDGTCPTAQPDPLSAGEIRTVTISTPKGNIVIQVEADLSPIAAGNFIALIDCHFYDGSVFHRTATLSDGTPFVIQGGAAKPGTSNIPYAIQDEAVTTTYARGTVAMARTQAANSQTSQFFIVLDDAAAPILVSNGNNYAIFGKVISGMDVADQIFQASGGAELPTNPIPMTSVTVSAPPPGTGSPAPSAAATTEPSSAATPAATSSTAP
jgi:peptidyl-prolyl cis-trans isomerase A (cyclophilin A)